jgi:hypothetical protein
MIYALRTSLSVKTSFKLTFTSYDTAWRVRTVPERGSICGLWLGFIYCLVMNPWPHDHKSLIWLLFLLLEAPSASVETRKWKIPLGTFGRKICDAQCLYLDVWTLLTYSSSTTFWVCRDNLFHFKPNIFVNVRQICFYLLFLNWRPLCLPLPVPKTLLSCLMAWLICCHIFLDLSSRDKLFGDAFLPIPWAGSWARCFVFFLTRVKISNYFTHYRSRPLFCLSQGPVCQYWHMAGAQKLFVSTMNEVLLGH